MDSGNRWTLETDGLWKLNGHYITMTATVVTLFPDAARQKCTMFDPSRSDTYDCVGSNSFQYVEEKVQSTPSSGREGLVIFYRQKRDGPGRELNSGPPPAERLSSSYSLTKWEEEPALRRNHTTRPPGHCKKHNGL